jgi:MFS family permease
MTTVVESPARRLPTGDGPRVSPAQPGRWWALVVLAMAQLMVVLDATIVNIALPTAQHALGFSDSGRQWVVTAYALAFGSLLLLGGRLSDFVGRRKMFIIGLIGFALASALGGAAHGIEMLIVARALQGAFAAALAPAALSLLSTTFTTPAERGKAFGISARSPAPAARSGCCSAACSPSTRPGAGACTSIWSSPPPR